MGTYIAVGRGGGLQVGDRQGETGIISKSMVEYIRGW